MNLTQPFNDHRLCVDGYYFDVGTKANADALMKLAAPQPAAECQRCGELETEIAVHMACHKRKIADLTAQLSRQQEVIAAVKTFINSPISTKSCADMNAAIKSLEEGKS